MASLPQSEDVIYVSLDVTAEEQARAAVSEIVGRFGRIDVLVNNAG
jgi:NAD(P)-dependent dehydrogenase (short-subunit alcohol dehydrogenase family)